MKPSNLWIVRRGGRHPNRGRINAAGFANSLKEAKKVAARLSRELLAQGAWPDDRPTIVAREDSALGI